MWNADHRCGTRIWLGSGSAVRVSVMTRAKVGLKVRFYLAAVLHNFSHSALYHIVQLCNGNVVRIRIMVRA